MAEIARRLGIGAGKIVSLNQIWLRGIQLELMTGYSETLSQLISGGAVDSNGNRRVTAPLTLTHGQWRQTFKLSDVSANVGHYCNIVGLTRPSLSLDASRALIGYFWSVPCSEKQLV